MKREIRLNETNYTDIEHIVLKDSDGNNAVFSETSDATASAADIMSGKTAFSNGSKITGAMNLVEKVIVSNGVYEASDYNAAGFSKIVADIAGNFCLPDNFTEIASGSIILAQDSDDITEVETGLTVPIKFAFIYSTEPKSSFELWNVCSFCIATDSANKIQCIVSVDENGALKPNSSSTAFSIDGTIIKSFGFYNSATFWKAGATYKWFAMG